MSVQSVTNGTTTTASGSASSVTGFSKTDFLKILTTQLKYQDPLNPSSPDQFMSQLAQLTEVESLQNIQSSLDALASKSSANQWLGAIGKRMEVQDTVMSPGDQIVLSPTAQYDTITLSLRNDADGTQETKTFKPGDSLVFTSEDKSYSITGLSATLDGQSVSCGLNLYRVIRGVQTTDSGTVMISGDGKTYDASNINVILQ